MSVQLINSTFTIPIGSFTIDSFIQINLNSSCNFNVYFYDQNGQQLFSQRIFLNGQDYHKWGNDDSYLKYYVAKYYGFTILENNVVMTGPTGEMTGSTGDMTGPTGDMTGPTGDMTGPTGDMTGSTGDMTGPTGDMTGPTGDMTGPTGDMTGPTGDMTGPTGENL